MISSIQILLVLSICALSRSSEMKDPGHNRYARHLRIHSHTTPYISDYPSMEELNKIGFFEESKNKCLFNTSEPMHNVNSWVGVSGYRQIANNEYNITNPVWLNGTTYWLNEFMAVGHLYIDIGLFQLLSSTKIDRVVLQRAPCFEVGSDLCQGEGTYKSFFERFFITAIKAANSSATIYVRFTGNDTNWLPLIVSSTDVGNKVISTQETAPIPVTPITCFDRILRRTGDRCFPNTISAPLARAFKRIAYESNLPIPIPFTLPPSNQRKQIVTVVFRGRHHTRSMENIEQFLRFLRDAIKNQLPKCDIIVKLFDLSVEANLHQQVEVAAESDILISTHGAFESNIIYMREHSYIIEIRGTAYLYQHEGPNFQALATNFLVNYDSVDCIGLRFHKQPSYILGDNDMNIIAKLTTDRLKQCKLK